MTLSYDTLTRSFLDKVNEYEFMDMNFEHREEYIDGLMKRSVAAFKNICEYDLSSNANDDDRFFDIDIEDEDFTEIVDILTEGMVHQWMKPFVYHQENLQLTLNTKDFTTYSPSELLKRVGDAYKQCNKDYTQMMREYSYNHGNLKDLHL